MTEGGAAALVLAVGLAFVTVVTVLVTRACAEGRVRRNGFMGLRTRRTQRSDVAWQAAHRAAEGPLRLALVVGVLTALLTPVVDTVLSSTAAWWFVMGASAAVIAVFVRAMRVADRAAEEA